ncbi:MAG: MBL fold metallo-hydrolase RNA specificity domain-containing protein [Ferruginibacter sp.]
MSAQGDSDDLTNFISCQAAEKVKQIFLAPGEYATQQAFAAKLERKGFSNIMIPAMHTEFELLLGYFIASCYTNKWDPLYYLFNFFARL